MKRILSKLFFIILLFSLTSCSKQVVKVDKFIDINILGPNGHGKVLTNTN